MTDNVMSTEQVIERYAELIREAAMEHLAPNWTLDLIEGGLDPEHLRMMADRWLDNGFEPANFAGQLDHLADEVCRNAAEIIPTKERN